MTTDQLVEKNTEKDVEKVAVEKNAHSNNNTQQEFIRAFEASWRENKALYMALKDR